MSLKKSAYLVISHGTRDPEGKKAFEDFLKKFRAAYPHRFVEGAFLSLAKPTVPEAIERCAGQGAEQIFILPLLFFPGRHAKEDIPRYIQEAKDKYPEIDFHYASPFFEHPEALVLLEKRIKTLKGEK